MKILLSILVVFVTACSGEQKLFHPQQQYTYLYKSKMLMSIPRIHSQHSGMGLEAHLKIQAERDQVLVQMQQPRYCESSNRVIVSSNWRNVNLSCQPVDSQQAQQLQKPFILRVERCKIKSIIFSKNTPIHIRNVKKAVAQLLQVDLCGEQPLPPQTSGAPSFFTVREKTMRGECEEEYQIPPPLDDVSKADLISKIKRASPESQWKQDPLSHQVRLLHKVRNPHKCRDKPVVRHIMPPALECYSEDCYQIAANSSIITTFVIEGDLSDACIRRVQSEETKTIYSNDPTSPLTTFSEQVLYLLKQEKSASKFPAIPDPDEHHNLTFQYPTQSPHTPPDSDLKSAPAIPPYMAGASVIISQSSAVQKVVQLIQSIQQQISQPSPAQPKPDPTSAVIECQKAMSLLSYDSIVSIPHQLQNEGQKDLFYSIVPVVGTKPAIKFIIDTVRAKSVPPIKTNLMLSVLPLHIKEPSVATMQALLDLLKAPELTAHQQSRWTLSLTIGTILNTWCVNNNTRHSHYPQSAEKLCQSPDMKQAISTFIHQMQTFIASGSDSDKQAYCQALGNLGSKNVIGPLQKIINEERTALTVSKALYALQRVSPQDPVRVRNIILSVFLNRNKPAKARLAAVISLISSNPPLHIMKLVATKTWTEPSAQVQALTYRMFKSLAEMRHPRSRRLSSIGQKAAICLSLIKPTTDATMFSTKYYLSQMMDQLDSQRQHAFCFLNNAFNVAPTNLYYHSNVYKNDRIDEVIKTSLDLDGVKLYKVIESLFRVPSTPSPIHQLPPDLAKVMEVLKKHNDKLEALPTIASLFVQIGSISRYWSYNITSSNFSFPQGQPWTKAVRTQAILFTEDKVEAVPSEIGIPMLIFQSNPTVLSLAGQIQVTNRSSENYYSIKYNNQHLYFETRYRLMMTTFSPFSRNELAVGTDSPVRVNVPPLEVAASVNLRTKAIEVRAALKQPSQQRIFQYERIPFTKAAPADQFDYKVPSPTVKPIEPRPKPDTKIELISAEYLKTELTIKRYPTKINQLFDWYQEHRWQHVTTKRYNYEKQAKMELTIYPSESKSAVLEMVLLPASLNSSVPSPPPTTKSVVQPSTFNKLIEEVKEIRQRIKQMPTAVNFTTAVAGVIATYPPQGGSQPTHSAKIHTILAYMPQNHTQLAEVAVHSPIKPIVGRVWIEVPQTSDSRPRLLSKPTHMPIKGEMQLGQTHLTVQAALETDPRGISQAENSPHAQRCQQHEAEGHPFSWDCERAKDQAAFPTRINAIVKASQVEPQHKDMLANIEEISKYLIHPYMLTRKYQTNPSNQVNLTLLLNQSRSTFDVFFRKPSETVQISSMKLPRLVRKVTMRRAPVEQVMNGIFGSVRCLINDKFIQTLDNKSIPIPPPKDSHQLVQLYQRSPKDYMAVLRKRSSVIVLVGPDQVQVKLSSGQSSPTPQYSVSVNGKPPRVVGKVPLLVESLQGGRYSGVYIYQKADVAIIAVERYDSQIRLSPSWLGVYVNPLLNSLGNGGLCCDYNRETTNELVDARGCVVTDPAKFVDSYYVKLPGDSYQPPPSNAPCHKTPVDYY